MSRLIVLFAVIVSTLNAFAQPEHASRKRNFNTTNNVAIREFDPVSYFKGTPAKGSAQFEYNHRGIFYYFVSEANREEFKKSPSQFEPMYGGWCAYTLAQKGQREKVQPTTFKIIDKKLYLFYNFNNENRLLLWNKGDLKKLKDAADKNWQKTMH